MAAQDYLDEMPQSSVWYMLLARVNGERERYVIERFANIILLEEVALAV
nr:hypothetical protein [Anatilimnocola floriformis]